MIYKYIKYVFYSLFPILLGIATMVISQNIKLKNNINNLSLRVNALITDLEENKIISIENTEIDNTSVSEYVDKIYKAYKQAKWEDVATYSTEYLKKANDTDINPVVYLYSSYAYYNIYRNNKNTEDFTKGMNNIDKYISDIPTNPNAYFTKGLLLMENGSINTNIQNLEKSVYFFREANSKNMSLKYEEHEMLTLYKLGEVYELSGQKRIAKDTYQKSLNLCYAITNKYENENLSRTDKYIKYNQNRLSDLSKLSTTLKTSSSSTNAP